MTDIPITLTDVTKEWLGEQLRNGGHDVPDIGAISHRRMDGFTGAMGEVGIFDVEWRSDSSEELPSAFVAKCPLDDDIARLYNEVMQFYVRESGFYRDLASEVAMRIPRCWVNRFDPETGRAFLLLEYLGSAQRGDILDGCSVETMHALVGDLARMHGQFWMDDRLLDVPWLLDWNAPNFPLGIEITQQSWAALAEAEPDRYPSDLARVLKATWIDNTMEWLDRYTRRPWTLAHLDYELDNVLIDAEGPVIVDWQSVMRSHPGVDLAWLLAVSHNEETLAAEPDLLSHYRSQLAAAGGPSWTEDELEHELAWGILYPAACQPVPYLQDVSAYGEGGERMHRRFEKFLQGSIDAAVRWNLVEHLGPLA